MKDRLILIITSSVLLFLLIFPFIGSEITSTSVRGYLDSVVLGKRTEVFSILWPQVGYLYGVWIPFYRSARLTIFGFPETPDICATSPEFVIRGSNYRLENCTASVWFQTSSWCQIVGYNAYTGQWIEYCEWGELPSWLTFSGFNFKKGWRIKVRKVGWGGGIDSFFQSISSPLRCYSYWHYYPPNYMIEEECEHLMLKDLNNISIWAIKYSGLNLSVRTVPYTPAQNPKLILIGKTKNLTLSLPSPLEEIKKFDIANFLKEELSEEGIQIFFNSSNNISGDILLEIDWLEKLGKTRMHSNKSLNFTIYDYYTKEKIDSAKSSLSYYSYYPYSADFLVTDVFDLKVDDEETSSQVIFYGVELQPIPGTVIFTKEDTSTGRKYEINLLYLPYERIDAYLSYKGFKYKNENNLFIEKCEGNRCTKVPAIQDKSKKLFYVSATSTSSFIIKEKSKKPFWLILLIIFSIILLLILLISIFLKIKRKIKK
ncbi:MAG: hypothetical protein QW199_00335 [Candidatus Pacearchaeota archaeon]